MARNVTTLGFDVRLFEASSSIRRSIFATKRGIDASRGLSRQEAVLKTVGENVDTLEFRVTSAVFVAATQPFEVTVTRDPATGPTVTYTERHSTFCLLTPSAGEGETITVVVRPATSVDTHVRAVSA